MHFPNRRKQEQEMAPKAAARQPMPRSLAGPVHGLELERGDCGGQGTGGLCGRRTGARKAVLPPLERTRSAEQVEDEAVETTAARSRPQHKPYRPRKNPAGRVAIPPIRALNQSGTLTDTRLREHERERSPEQSEALALWIAKARQTLERLLDLQRAVSDSALDLVPPSSEHSPHHNELPGVLMTLQRDLELLGRHNFINDTVQDPSLAILDKMKNLAASIGAKLADRVRSKSSPTKRRLRIPDAQVVVSGPDGKRMFFKLREGYGTHLDERDTSPVSEDIPHVQDDAPPSLLSPHINFTGLYRGLRGRVWPEWLLLGAQRVRGTRLIVRTRWLQSRDALKSPTTSDADLEIAVYNPATAKSSLLRLSRRLLPLTYRRRRANQRADAAPDATARLVQGVLRCCNWADDLGIDIRLPIQHREARILSYRAYATVGALISLRVNLDESCEVTVIDTRTAKTWSISLSEAQVSAALGKSFLEPIVESPNSRGRTHRSICKKLFVEHTSQGLEVLFPGVKPRGKVCRHPAELVVLQQLQQQALKQREAATKRMYVCALQAAAIGKRKEKERQFRRESAAKRLQAQSRRIISKRQRQRAHMLRQTAAIVIQARVRQVQAKWRVQRRRRAREDNRSGSFFRFACRINGTFVLATIRVIAVDGCDSCDFAAIDELRIAVCHPVSADIAHTSVARSGIDRVIGSDSTPRTRLELMNLIVRRHLDVFRSVRHNLLVVAFRTGVSSTERYCASGAETSDTMVLACDWLRLPMIKRRR